MTLQENVSLKPFNTFGIDVKAKFFASVNNLDELHELISSNQYPNTLFLGGGSNILLTKDINALVVHLNLKGIEVTSENEASVIVKVAAGENWHDFVMWCVDQNYGGIENLSLIPGNVGTAPIQNIGAYGVELKDVFLHCEALDLATKSIKTFTNADCQFDYRNSIFKNEVKGQYIITSVSLKLNKPPHQLSLAYGAISNELEKSGIIKPTIKDVSNTVIAIRQSKLPDPSKIGNSGSFFKNPIVDKLHYHALNKQFDNVPHYPISEEQVKIPAGWLIEKAGFKGKTFGNYGVHKQQALVLVNYGGAKGKDIFELSKLIQHTVERLFAIKLEAEVNIL